MRNNDLRSLVLSMEWNICKVYIYTRDYYGGTQYGPLGSGEYLLSMLWARFDLDEMPNMESLKIEGSGTKLISHARKY